MEREQSKERDLPSIGESGACFGEAFRFGGFGFFWYSCLFLGARIKCGRALAGELLSFLMPSGSTIVGVAGEVTLDNNPIN